MNDKKPAIPPGTLCGYSYAHARKNIPATTTIDCGPVGPVHCCQTCADFYERINNATR